MRWRWSATASSRRACWPPKTAWPHSSNSAWAPAGRCTRSAAQQIEGQVEGRLVIVLDSDRARIRLGQAVADDAARTRFIALARAAGALVIDTQPLFVAHHARSPLCLDVAPYDAHMNRLAIDMATHAASQALAGPH